MEFQHAKKSLRKPVIPLVVGEGSFDWMCSVVGMLIAGELFIHFKNKDYQADKNAEMMGNIRNFIHEDEGEDGHEHDPTKEKDSGPKDVFLSYCWVNSQFAEDAKHIGKVNGSKLSDPRLLKTKLEDHGYKVWLDIEQLESANPDAGLFGQIAEGLKKSKVVIPCISDDYSKSPNCRMEFQFALKSLYKPAVPIVVGYGEEWKKSVVGALMITHDKEPIDLQGIEDESVMEEKFAQILSYIESTIGKPNNANTENTEHTENNENNEEEADNEAAVNGDVNTSSSRAPKVGDHVVSHHKKNAYYMATVAHFDTSTMTYTVDWDDGDPSGKFQQFDQVARDEAPEVDDIGEGSIVFFAQGGYGGTDGNNTGGVRYHEGEVTEVKRLEDGVVLVSGHHTKGEEEKWITYNGYFYTFNDVPLHEIRLAATALEAIF